MRKVAPRMPKSLLLTSRAYRGGSCKKAPAHPNDDPSTCVDDMKIQRRTSLRRKYNAAISRFRDRCNTFDPLPKLDPEPFPSPNKLSVVERFRLMQRKCIVARKRLPQIHQGTIQRLPNQTKLWRMTQLHELKSCSESVTKSNYQPLNQDIVFHDINQLKVHDEKSFENSGQQYRRFLVKSAVNNQSSFVQNKGRQSFMDGISLKSVATQNPDQIELVKNDSQPVPTRHVLRPVTVPQQVEIVQAHSFQIPKTNGPYEKQASSSNSENCYPKVLQYKMQGTTGKSALLAALTSPTIHIQQAVTSGTSSSLRATSIDMRPCTTYQPLITNTQLNTVKQDDQVSLEKQQPSVASAVGLHGYAINLAPVYYSKPSTTASKTSSGSNAISETLLKSADESTVVKSMLEHHALCLDINGSPMHRCTACNKVFTVLAAFKTHVTTHSKKKTSCPICGKMFTRSWVLKGHLRTHTGERPFSCGFPGCGRAFADRSNLRSHALTHNVTDKRYVCARCHKTFAQKRYLHKHCLEVCRA